MSIATFNHIADIVLVILENPGPNGMSSCGWLRVDGLYICSQGVKTSLLKSLSGQMICVVDIGRKISPHLLPYELSVFHVFVNICQRLDDVEAKAFDEQFCSVN